MRYLIFDEDGILMRKFWSKEDAEKFLQEGWRVEVLPKTKKQKPTTETYGEARW